MDPTTRSASGRTRVMAVNSAVEVTSRGRFAPTRLAMRIISGVGGQHDFMYGGALSEGGKPSSPSRRLPPKGESKIKALLTPGARRRDDPPHGAAHRDRKYGVAHLRGPQPRPAGAGAIAVAHPSVREELGKSRLRTLRLLLPEAQMKRPDQTGSLSEASTQPLYQALLPDNRGI